jgi:hypothetical protein
MSIHETNGEGGGETLSQHRDWFEDMRKDRSNMLTLVIRGLIQAL